MLRFVSLAVIATIALVEMRVEAFCPGLAGPSRLRLSAANADRFSRKISMSLKDDKIFESSVGRRSLLISLISVATGLALPRKSNAEGAPLTPQEAEEYAKLMEEAKRLQGLFDDMKSANSNLPKLKAPSTASAASPSAPGKPSPKLTAEEVASNIFTALKNNDSPAPNTGLKVTLEFSSPLNPVKRQPFESFVQVMQAGKYSILLGKFDKFAITAADTRRDETDTSTQISMVDVRVQATPKVFAQCRMPEDFLEEVGDGRSKAVTFRLQLRKSPETNDCWMSDTLYLVNPAPRA